MIMKKSILLIPIIGLMVACSGGADQPKETPEQIQSIEQSTETLGTTVDSSKVEIDKAQGEIDQLLKDI